MLGYKIQQKIYNNEWSYSDIIDLVHGKLHSTLYLINDDFQFSQSNQNKLTQTSVNHNGPVRIDTTFIQEDQIMLKVKNQ
jgi:hypothetical protein